MRRAVLSGLLAVVLSATSAAAAERAPAASHHQHLISPAAAALWGQPELDAAALVAQLDAAGIERAAVLSMAYVWGDERRPVDDPARRAREENDWTSAQVARFPTRLVGFCSANPLRDEAAAEIERCLDLPGMKGVKLHLGNSGVDVHNPDHVARVAAVFAVAERRGAAVVVHMRARSGMPYGAPEAAIFLNEILPSVPNVMVQVAHLAGAGPGFPDNAQQAFTVFADAIAANDPRVRNVWFDVTTVVTPDATPDDVAAVVQAIRRAGPSRVLFGADASIGGNPAPAEAWAIFRGKLDLTDEEFDLIAGNLAPYMR